MSIGQKTVTKFIREFKEQNSIEKDILIKLSNLDTFNAEELDFDKTILNEEELSKLKCEYDLVVGDLPFGMQRISSELLPKRKINQNWNSIYKSLKLLNNGNAFFIVEPSIISSPQGKEFLFSLEQFDFFLNFAFNVPDKIYTQTGFRPILIGFSKKKTDKLFIADLEFDNVNTIVQNAINQIGENIANGILIERNSFTSFHKFTITNQIKNLKTQYKEYEEHQLLHISKSINLTRGEFEDIQNSIYIPKIGNSNVVATIEDTKIKHQNYFQIELDETIVLAEYLAIFYKSELGQLILSSLSSGFIPSQVT